MKSPSTSRSLAPLVLAALAFTGGCASNDDAATLTSSEAAETASSAKSTPVFINHTMGVFSQATIDAIQTSEYLNQDFVDVQIRTTVRPDITYSGTYLNARETYLELFSEGTLGFPLGLAEMGLGDDTQGGLQAVSGEWAKAFGADQVSTGLTQHEVNGVETPWFNEVDMGWAQASDYFGLWDMQYVPGAGQKRPRTRHEERASTYDSGKLVQNIQGVVFGLDASDFANVKTSLSAVGWPVFPVGTGYLAISPRDHGTRRLVYVQPSSTGRQGLLGVVFRLNHFTAEHTELLGDAKLEVGIAGLPFATLWFVPEQGDEKAVAASDAF